MKRFSPAYWNLLWRMTVTDFKLKDEGTILGFLWTMLYPALMFLVLYLLFTKWMGNHVENYPAYLLIGILQWQFFEKVTTVALSSLFRADSLIKNFKFPLEILPLSSALSVFISYILEVVVLLIFLVILKTFPNIHWLYLPFMMFMLFIFSAAVGMLLSILSLEYKDMQRIWTILMMVGFFITPVFYPISILSPDRQHMLLLNPMLHVIDAFRAELMGRPMETSYGVMVVFSLGIAGMIYAFYYFKRNGWKLVDRIVSM